MATGGQLEDGLCRRQRLRPVDFRHGLEQQQEAPPTGRVRHLQGEMAGPETPVEPQRCRPPEQQPCAQRRALQHVKRPERRRGASNSQGRADRRQAHYPQIAQVARQQPEQPRQRPEAEPGTGRFDGATETVAVGDERPVLVHPTQRPGRLVETAMGVFGVVPQRGPQAVGTRGPGSTGVP